MPEPRPGRGVAGFWQWVRHHLVAITATLFDYGAMISAVELLRLRPVPATAVGASVGGLTSFILGRFFTYRATNTGVASQSWRYVLVWAASFGLNVGGEHLFANVLGLEYLVARVITSVIVSNAWNYPLQRFFVFSRRPAHAEHPTPPR